MHDIESGQIIGGALLITLFLISAAIVGASFGIGPFKLASFGGGTGTGTGTGGGCYGGYVPPTGWQCTSLKINFAVNDPLPTSGNAANAATIAIYDPVSLGVKEAPATASDGTVSTSNPYTTGQCFVAKITLTSYVTSWYPFCVPPISNAATQVTTISVPFFVIKLGTWVVSASVTGGTTWTTSFATYSFANTGLSSITANFVVTETVNNAGYLNSYSIVNKITELFVVKIDDGGSATVTVSGYQMFSKQGTVQHWMWVLPDGLTTLSAPYALNTNGITQGLKQDNTGRYVQVSPVGQTLSINGVQTTGALTMQLSGTTQLGNNAQFSVNFNKGSLSAGSSMIMNMNGYYYADPVYYQTFGTFGADVVTLSTSYWPFFISFKN